MKRVVRFVAIGAVLVAAGISTAPAASGALGTFTKITSPKGPGQSMYQFYDYGAISNHTVNVAGTASLDVANVNVFCFRNGDKTATSGTPYNAAPIPVSGGNFAGAISIPELDFPCVLRAVPDTYTDIDSSTGANTGYVGAFAGPIYHDGGYNLQKNTAGRIVQWVALSSQSQATTAAGSIDTQGALLQTAIDQTATLSSPYGTLGAVRLTSGNLVASGSPTKSAIVIDGINAYAPAALSSFAADQTTVPAVTVSKSHSSSNGAMTLKETVPLRSCAGNAYPQSTTTPTCTPVATGVNFVRTVVTSSTGTVMTIRDKFNSTDGHTHQLKLEYQSAVQLQDQGEPGLMRPGQSSFSKMVPGTTFTNVPSGAHTILATSDIHAADGSADHSDAGLTYSAKPASLFVGALDTGSGLGQYGLRYTRTVPAGGSVGFGWATEVGFTVSAVKSLAAPAQRAMAPHLSLTAPASSTSDNTPTIKGKVTNAVNGFPAKVTITIGTKSKTVTVNKSTGAFQVTWTSLANGKHTAKAKATDPSGITLSASRTFTCT